MKTACYINFIYKGFSTITALTCITNDMFNSMENKEITLLTLLDLSKAFDSLDHGMLVTSPINIVLPSHLQTIWLTEHNA